MADEKTEVPEADRVVLKPDGRGGFTVDKFGASAHFNAQQWRSLMEGADALEEDGDDGDEKSSQTTPEPASATRKPQGGK